MVSLLLSGLTRGRLSGLGRSCISWGQQPGGGAQGSGWPAGWGRPLGQREPVTCILSAMALVPRMLCFLEGLGAACLRVPVVSQHHQNLTLRPGLWTDSAWISSHGRRCWKKGKRGGQGSRAVPPDKAELDCTAPHQTPPGVLLNSESKSHPLPVLGEGKLRVISAAEVRQAARPVALQLISAALELAFGRASRAAGQRSSPRGPGRSQGPSPQIAGASRRCPHGP